MSTKEEWQRLASVVEAVHAPGGRERYGACAVEGTRIVTRAIRAGAEIRRAIVTKRFLDDDSERGIELQRSLAQQGCPMMLVPLPAFERITAGRDLGGIVALAELPRRRTLADVVAQHGTGPMHLIACVSFNDPGNVGALVRTAHANGVAAVLAVDATDAYHPKAIRTSMGSVFRVPIVSYPDIHAMAAELATHKVHTVGSVTSGGGAVTELENLPGSTAIVMGPEAFGLDAEQQKALDELVTIPMPGGIDSLSVNAAAAVLLHELRRMPKW